MPVNRAKIRKAALKEQLLVIAASLNKKQRLKPPKTPPPVKILKSVTHLRQSIPDIHKKLNRYAILLLIDPIRALQDIGYTLSPKIQRHLLASGIKIPKNRTVYDAVKKGTRKIEGIKRVRITIK